MSSTCSSLLIVHVRLGDAKNTYIAIWTSTIPHQRFEQLCLNCDGLNKKYITRYYFLKIRRVCGMHLTHVWCGKLERFIYLYEHQNNTNKTHIANAAHPKRENMFKNCLNFVVLQNPADESLFSVTTLDGNPCCKLFKNTSRRLLRRSLRLSKKLFTSPLKGFIALYSA